MTKTFKKLEKLRFENHSITNQSFSVSYNEVLEEVSWLWELEKTELMVKKFENLKKFWRFLKK